jgi:hypothetical protein
MESETEVHTEAHEQPEPPAPGRDRTGHFLPRPKSVVTADPPVTGHSKQVKPREQAKRISPAAGKSKRASPRRSLS